MNQSAHTKEKRDFPGFIFNSLSGIENVETSMCRENIEFIQHFLCKKLAITAKLTIMSPD